MRKIIGTLILLSIWKVVSPFVDPIVLPEPTVVLKKVIWILRNDYSEIFTTITRINLTFILVIFLGTILGLLISISEGFYKLFKPVIIFMQSTPIISWLLLALIWFDSKSVPYFIGVISSLPILILNIRAGVKNCDSKLLEMAKLYKVSPFKRATSIFYPSLVPFILPAIKSITTNLFKIIVMAEVIVKLPKGIGNGLNIGWLNIETEIVLAWTVIILFCSYFYEKIISFILERVWRKYL